MKESRITSLNAGQKVEKFVKKFLPEAPLGFIYKAFRKKDIKVNGHWVKKDFVLSEGDVVRIYVTDAQLADFAKPRPAEKKPFPYPILYEDDNVLIVNKPKGVLVYGDKTGVRETLGNAVLDYLYLKGEFDPSDHSFVPSPAHRLDRNTSGVVCYGKTDAALKALTDLFKERDEIQKEYLALVVGDVATGGRIDKPLKKDEYSGRVSIAPLSEGGKTAITDYYVEKRFGDYTLLRLDLLTGRTHQLRVHLASIHHPIVGDEKYGDFEDCRKLKRLTGIDYQLLHAHKISFKNVSGVLSPLKGKEIAAPMPKEISIAIEKLCIRIDN
ncbi:MAG: RluA family pseudouridine synthase [Bacilli bacterium]|nr:RluA family pseudouridine synthase [Bacilli bacterium]